MEKDYLHECNKNETNQHLSIFIEKLFSAPDKLFLIDKSENYVKVVEPRLNLCLSISHLEVSSFLRGKYNLKSL